MGAASQESRVTPGRRVCYTRAAVHGPRRRTSGTVQRACMVWSVGFARGTDPGSRNWLTELTGKWSITAWYCMRCSEMQQLTRSCGGLLVGQIQGTRDVVDQQYLVHITTTSNYRIDCPVLLSIQYSVPSTTQYNSFDNS